MDATRLALKRLAKIAALAVIPVAISSLESGDPDLRAMAVAGVTAVLGAVLKYLEYDPQKAEVGREIERELAFRRG